MHTIYIFINKLSIKIGTLIRSISSILILRSATFIVDRSPSASRVCRMLFAPEDMDDVSYCEPEHQPLKSLKEDII